MDAIDRRILACLQEDATKSLVDVAEHAGVSPSPCWRRIQRLTDDGVIRRRVALLDPKKINVGVNVFVQIRTNQHSAHWAACFCRAVAAIPEVVEFYKMSGNVDYLLRVVIPDIESYDGVYKRLIDTVEIYDVSSSFAIETIKYTTALPVNYATDEARRR